MKCIVHNAALDASNPCLDVNVDLWVALADADLCARFDQGGHHKLLVAEKVCGFNTMQTLIKLLQHGKFNIKKRKKMK